MTKKQKRVAKILLDAIRTARDAEERRTEVAAYTMFIDATQPLCVPECSASTNYAKD